MDTVEGWLNLAVVLDLYSCQVVGSAIATTLKGAFTSDALQKWRWTGRLHGLA